jgi:hypothetical protein
LGPKDRPGRATAKRGPDICASTMLNQDKPYQGDTDNYLKNN